MKEFTNFLVDGSTRPLFYLSVHGETMSKGIIAVLEVRKSVDVWTYDQEIVDILELSILNRASALCNYEIP